MNLNTDTFIAIVRCTMLAGVLYDLAFAVPIIAAPAWLARIIGVPMPDQEIYLRFTGVFLIGLAILYLLPVLHPGRYLGNVAAAAAIRALGGVFMVVAVFAFGQPRAFLLLGAGDLAFAAVHFVSLVPFGGLSVWRLAGADLSPRAPGRIPGGRR